MNPKAARRDPVARPRLAPLLFAGAKFLQFLTPTRDLQTLRLHFKTQSMADFTLEPLDLFAVKLDDLVAIVTDDMAMVGMVGVIGIIILVILAEIHLAHQPAFGQ